MASRQSSGDKGPAEQVDDLRLALNGLRREHRQLKEKVEDRVLDYIEEEKEVLEELEGKIDSLGDLVRQVDDNATRIAEMGEAVAALEDAADDREQALEDLQEDVMSLRAESRDEDDELLERVRKLETRMNTLAERLD